MSSHPANEPILDYAPDSDERKALESEIKSQMSEVIEIEIKYTSLFWVIEHSHGELGVYDVIY